MTFLLDTHTYLWTIDESPRLSRTAVDLIESSETQLVLSMASLWEIAIKLSIGKLRLELAFADVAMAIPVAHDMEILPITVNHLDIVSRLPTHHRDPFDRLLVAQCLAEDMAIVSNDTILDAYGVERLW